eukprot:2842896-Rhodomonas_salina.1
MCPNSALTAASSFVQARSSLLVRSCIMSSSSHRRFATLRSKTLSGSRSHRSWVFASDSAEHAISEVTVRFGASRICLAGTVCNFFSQTFPASNTLFACCLTLSERLSVAAHSVAGGKSLGALCAPSVKVGIPARVFRPAPIHKIKRMMAIETASTTQESGMGGLSP